MTPPGDDLERWFESHDGRLIQKWQHYFSAYDRHFAKFQGCEIVLLEIGISQGGSIEMWKSYFGKGLRYFGIDVDPHCRMFAEPGVEIFIGSQDDPEFLRAVAKQIPLVDILVDDGGHTMRQQITTLDVLFDKIKNGGVYLCEDTHTSYRLEHGGGFRRRGTFIERAKQLIDNLHAHHSEQNRFRPDRYTSDVGSLHFYDSMLFIEKERRSAPVEQWRGYRTFDVRTPPRGVLVKGRDRIRRNAKKALRAAGLKDATNA